MSEYTHEEAKYILYYSLWLFIPLVAGATMMSYEHFWGGCLMALCCRIVMKFIGYSHITCTIIGVASIVLSYVFPWFVDTQYIDYYTPFWIRLIWGLLL